MSDIDSVVDEATGDSGGETPATPLSPETKRKMWKRQASKKLRSSQKRISRTRGKVVVQSTRDLKIDRLIWGGSKIIDGKAAGKGNALVRPRSLHKSSEEAIVKWDSASLVELKRVHASPLSRVSICFHVDQFQLVVLKRVKPPKDPDDKDAKYLLAETTLLAQLASPFIVKLLSTWREGPAMYTALEPLLGGDLEDAMKSSPSGALPLEQCRFYAACAVLALKHLSENLICHRDIKPCNMMLDHRGYLKLIDFGISKQFATDATRTFTFCGSPKFMAPELVEIARGCGAGYSMGVDWWALGVSLFEIATGYHPLVGADGDATSIPITVYFHRIISFSTSSGDALAPLDDFDAAYASFVRGLMHPKPSDRLGSSELLDGARGAMAHAVFDSVSWDKLEEEAGSSHAAAIARRRLQAPRAVLVFVSVNVVSE